MCVRTIKTMLFILACSAIITFAPATASAAPSHFDAAQLPAARVADANPLANDSAAQAPEPGTLLLFGMGLVLTGTALRRKEGKTE